MSVLRAAITRRQAPRLEAELELSPGITALFGPSGAGKTTLLHALAGLIRPEAGRIECEGVVLFDAAAGIDVPPEHRRVGVVFQEPRLFPHRSVRQNLLYGAPRSAANGRALSRIVDLLELGDLLSRRPGTLSGGEQRRVSIGRTLLAEPAVVLLDEPLAGLDEARKEAVVRLLSHAQRALALPFVLVSHSLPDILRLTTRLIVVEEGRTIAQGELVDVLDSERVFRLADRLGLETHLEVRIEGRREGLTVGRLGPAELLLPPIDAEPGEHAVVAIGPEDVILSRSRVEGTSAQNCLPGTVTRVSRLSDRLLVTMDVGGPLRVAISEKAGKALGVEPGAELWCLIKAFSFRWRRAPLPKAGGERSS